MPGARELPRHLVLARMAAQEGLGEPGSEGMLFPSTETAAFRSCQETEQSLRHQTEIHTDVLGKILFRVYDCR